MNHPPKTDSHSNAAERERREAALDETIEESFRASDPPSSGPNPDTQNVIWAAGVTGSPLGQSPGVDTDRIGRVKVLPDLSLPGYPEVFVIGDLMVIGWTPNNRGVHRPSGRSTRRKVTARSAVTGMCSG